MSSLLDLGDIALVSFPYHTLQGHEQEGIHPAVVIYVPNNVRYPVL